MRIPEETLKPTGKSGRGQSSESSSNSEQSLKAEIFSENSAIPSCGRNLNSSAVNPSDVAKNENLAPEMVAHIFSWDESTDHLCTNSRTTDHGISMFLLMKNSFGVKRANILSEMFGWEVSEPMLSDTPDQQ